MLASSLKISRDPPPIAWCFSISVTHMEVSWVLVKRNSEQKGVQYNIRNAAGEMNVQQWNRAANPGKQ